MPQLVGWDQTEAFWPIQIRRYNIYFSNLNTMHRPPPCFFFDDVIKDCFIFWLIFAWLRLRGAQMTETLLFACTLGLENVAFGPLPPWSLCNSAI